jgi:hypothetical protein
MAFDQHIDTCVALILKESDPKYGHIGKIEVHDWNESGEMRIRFADGTSDRYLDGHCGAPLEAEVYSHKDGFPGYMFDLSEAGPKSLRDVLKLGRITEEQLRADYRQFYGRELNTDPNPLA